METQRATTYYVNGERQETDEDKLTVREILDRAGFKPAEEYEVVRDHPHHVFTNPDEMVEIHRDERFTAVFRGPTPTS